MAGFTHSTGFSSKENGYAVGKSGSEQIVITPSGGFTPLEGQGLTPGLGRFPAVQKTGVVAAASATSIHAAVTLAAAAQTVTADITNPDVYRCLQVKGNASGIAGNVVITGTDWAGQTITDTIALNGTAAVDGVKPFKTVISISLPAKTNDEGDAVSVGCCDKLGLYRPIAAATDVIEVGRKASAATSYTVEAVGTVNVTYGTVIQGAAITASDSIEINYLVSTI